MGLLKNCVKEYHQTLVMITHDETIAQMADRIVMIEDGKVVRNSGSEKLLLQKRKTTGAKIS